MNKYPITINNVRNIIIWKWFLGFKNQIEIFEEINPLQYKKGINSYESKERKHNNGRISIIAWGKVNMNKKFV